MTAAIDAMGLPDRAIHSDELPWVPQRYLSFCEQEGIEPQDLRF